MKCLDSIEELSDEWIEEFTTKFKEMFVRDFNYLKDETLEPPERLEYVTNEDIKRALFEALAIFPCSIFESDEVGILALLYLTAHYLCEDFRNAKQGLNSVGTFPATSTTVRNVSESYAIPGWITNNPQLSYIAETGYGKKYLSLYWPRTIGRIRVVGGWTIA